ncbi:hypothetical protein [Salmonirosea aquatica]|uniref:Uncharacterized protein n=1 Tax=Salmonirosea aquatica TaxID=2654236 RepID=A0A7C9BFP7_9BACT|nr:hypothetical protein [Cytophagaceae bacterium SJW1-29]
MKKSNIFAYAELEKLVGNLLHAKSNLKEHIVAQAAYFHIIDSRYFSDELAPIWDEIRTKLGYSSTQALKGQQFLKNNMLEAMKKVSEEECREIIKQINQVFEGVKNEFNS